MNTVFAGVGEADGPPRGRIPILRSWMLWLGAAALAVPTIVRLAQGYWSDETGGHGPIVLATGIWLFVRARHDVAAVARPGVAWLAWFVFWGSLLGYLLARNTGMLGVECLGVYGMFLAVFYYHAGYPGVRLLWFPLIYLLFMFPQPETLILPLSQVLKLGLSGAAVSVLSAFGYAVGNGGVVIYVDQYELLVASACSGLNSMIGLSAICVFYAYIRYGGDWRASLPLLVTVLPIALFANFVRVLVLILVTHYFGIRVAEAYIHDIAGIMLFALAVAMMLGVDTLLEWRRARTSA